MIRAIIGAGGHAREVKWQMGDNNLISFVDDEFYIPNTDNIKPLSEFNSDIYEVIVCIGDSMLRKKMVDKLPNNTKYFTFIHRSSIIGDDIVIGDGSFIGAHSIVTTNIIIGKHSILNRGCHIGHDTIIGDFISMMPNSVISGNCSVGECVYMGTNSSIRQKINICDNVVIGLNSGVVKDITQSGTYGGLPVKLLK